MSPSASIISVAGNSSGCKTQQPPVVLQLVDSQDLLRGNKAVTIQHNGSIYRLQATKLGKLILTK